MKKRVLFTFTFLMGFGLMAQNCIQTLPSTVIDYSSDGDHIGAGDQLWICEDIVFEVSGNNNTVYIEKGGAITISGDGNTVYMKSDGSLDISGDGGSYTIDSGVVVTDVGNSSLIDTCFVSVLDPLIFDYQLISGITDCIDTGSGSVGIVPLEVNEITLFPNPVRNVLNVNVPSITGPSSYRVYSVSGNIVLEGIMATSSEQLDMSELQRGLYFIEIQNQSGKVSKRLSVE